MSTSLPSTGATGGAPALLTEGLTGPYTLEAPDDDTAVEAALDAERYGRDLLLPDARGVKVTRSGDWPAISGVPNLLSAHRRRAATAAGQVVHRPEYGGGLLLYLEEPSDLTTRTRAANEVRANALRDRRVSEVGVTSFIDDHDRVVIELTLHPRGDEPVTTSVTLE